MENLFLALSDRTRLQLLSLMGSNEVSVGYLCESLGQSQPKISRHLAYLRTAGLVSTRRDGKWIYYKIDPPGNTSGRALLANALNWMSGNGEAAVHTLGANEVEVVFQEISSDGFESDFVPNELEIHLL
jgi:DNA-binding transcriptional ArsR family regulator